MGHTVISLVMSTDYSWASRRMRESGYPKSVTRTFWLVQRQTSQPAWGFPQHIAVPLTQTMRHICKRTFRAMANSVMMLIGAPSPLEDELARLPGGPASEKSQSVLGHRRERLYGYRQGL